MSLMLCLFFFSATQVEAQSSKIFIPQDVTAMQTLITNFETKTADLPASPKLAHYSQINDFYVEVVADVQNGMSYKAALMANVSTHPNYDPSTQNTTGQFGPQ